MFTCLNNTQYTNINLGGDSLFMVIVGQVKVKRFGKR